MNYKAANCKRFLDKSNASYESADSDFNAGRFDRAISSLYYSAFQCIIALMSLREEKSSTHKYVRSFVNRELGKTGLISIELCRMYNTLLDMRMDADYSVEVVYTKENVEGLLKKVIEFNTSVKKLIEEEM